VRARLFWKLGLTYFALLLGVLLAVDFYSSRVLRRDYIRAADDKLASLLNIAQARPPRLDDTADLRAWTEWMGRSGARVTVIDNTGLVLADSQHDPETMENHSNRPEIQQAFATGEGQSVRHSATLGRDGELTASIDVKNTGTRTGKEVVQLYVSDLYRSLTPPNRELKGFRKIELKPGESQTISFTLKSADLAFVGMNNRWITEPGKFRASIGKLSEEFTLV